MREGKIYPEPERAKIEPQRNQEGGEAWFHSPVQPK
jgi:hypothetical protein